MDRELPRRNRGDELLKPAAVLDLRDHLRRNAQKHDLTSVSACAFDRRTRMLPFFYADKRLAPAGVELIPIDMTFRVAEPTRKVISIRAPNITPSGTGILPVKPRAGSLRDRFC